MKVICINAEAQTHDLQTRLINGNIYNVLKVEDNLFYPKVGYVVEGLEFNVFGGEAYYESIQFASIQTNYADATAEILEKFKSPVETPDKIIIPEPINQIP